MVGVAQLVELWIAGSSLHSDQTNLSKEESCHFDSFIFL